MPLSKGRSGREPEGRRDYLDGLEFGHSGQKKHEKMMTALHKIPDILVLKTNLRIHLIHTVCNHHCESSRPSQCAYS